MTISDKLADSPRVVRDCAVFFRDEKNAMLIQCSGFFYDDVAVLLHKGTDEVKRTLQARPPKRLEVFDHGCDVLLSETISDGTFVMMVSFDYYDRFRERLTGSSD